MPNIAEILSKISIPAIIYAVNFIFIFAVLFFERKSSAARLAWIMVLAFIPIVGFIFYLVFNQNLSRMHINHLYDDEWEAFQTMLIKQMNKESDDDTSDMINPAAISRKDIIKLNQVYGESIYTEGNEAELITDGNELLISMLDDIRASEKSIFAEYFIIKNDLIGKKFIRELTFAAERGVDVKLLIDTQGSRRIGKRALKDYLNAGAKIG